MWVERKRERRCELPPNPLPATSTSTSAFILRDIIEGLLYFTSNIKPEKEKFVMRL